MHKANFVGNEEIQQGSVPFADRSPDAPVILDKKKMRKELCYAR